MGIALVLARSQVAILEFLALTQQKVLRTLYTAPQDETFSSGNKPFIHTGDGRQRMIDRSKYPNEDIPYRTGSEPPGTGCGIVATPLPCLLEGQPLSGFCHLQTGTGLSAGKSALVVVNLPLFQTVLPWAGRWFLLSFFTV